jgi:hypothetical protein
MPELPGSALRAAEVENVYTFMSSERRDTSDLRMGPLDSEKNYVFAVIDPFGNFYVLGRFDPGQLARKVSSSNEDKFRYVEEPGSWLLAERLKEEGV